jgi:Domain of unknown function (DUF397)
MSTSDGWFKSTRSGGSDNCLEVQHQPDGSTAVRHSKNSSGLQLQFSPDMWTGLLETVQMTRFPADSGEWSLARPHHGACAQARHAFDGSVKFTHTAADPHEVLTFTAEEWFAFTEGVRAGELAWRPQTVQAS